MKRYFRYDPETKTVVECDKSVSAALPRYPMACEALAVHPEMIGEARQFAQDNGVPTDFRSDGTPMMRDAGHYKRYRRLNKVHFRNSYDD